MKFFQQIILPFVILLSLDSIYLTTNYKYFQTQVVKVQHAEMIPKIGGIIACYLFLIFGLYHFIIKPHKTPFEALLFGLVIYGVYETTTYSLLKNWDLKTVFIDTAWGGILFYLTTYITYEIMRFF